MAERRGAAKRVKPLTDEDYRQIAEMIDQGMTRNAIAEKMGRGTATISRAAVKLGKTFDRTRTAAATEAFRQDMASRRAKLASDLLDDAARLRERLWQPARMIVSTKEGPEVIQMELPNLRDTRDGAYAVQMALKGHLELIRIDQGDGVDKAKAMITALGEALGVKTQTEQPPQPYEPTFEK